MESRGWAECSNLIDAFPSRRSLEGRQPVEHVVHLIPLLPDILFVKALDSAIGRAANAGKAIEPLVAIGQGGLVLFLEILEIGSQIHETLVGEKAHRILRFANAKRRLQGEKPKAGVVEIVRGVDRQGL